MATFRLTQSSAFMAPQLTDAALIARYDAAAADWHARVARLGYRRAYANLLAEAAALGDLPSQPATLDCGTGSGLFALALCDVLGALPQLAAVDASPAMVQEARRQLQRAGQPADVRCADARALPFGDRHFDLVTSSHMLEHLADPQPALGEMRRVLRPGGVLLLVVSRPGLITRWLRRRWGHAAYQPARCVALLRAAGLQPTRVLPLGGMLARHTSFAVLAQRPLEVTA